MASDAKEAAVTVTAADKVFAVPELLEIILMNMRIDEILVNAQRVNKM